MIEFANLHFDEKNGKLAGCEFDGNTYAINGGVWNVEIKNDNTVRTLTIDDMTSFTYKTVNDVLILTWENEELTVWVNISGKDKTHWTINTELNGDGGVNKVVFPIIGGLTSVKKNKDDYMIIPWQNGHLAKNPIEILKADSERFAFWLGRGGGKYEMEYPASLNFQYYAYYTDANVGCYFGVEDGEGYIKTMGYYLEDNDDFSYRLTSYPENMGNTKSYCMPYSFAFTFFNGDWQTATNIYREWAIKQKWCKKGKLSQRYIPDKLKKTDLWRINHTDYAHGTKTQEYFDSAKIIKEKANCSLALHWYGWNMGEHDVNYPEYIDREMYAKGWGEELAEWNKRFDGEEVVKIPYVNARLWDTGGLSWKEENAYRSAVKDGNGEMLYEPWKTGNLKPMCPATSQWQNKVADFCGRYVTEEGFDGLYIDQIASYNAVLCFDQAHPHPIGGGNWWNNSYHKIIEQVRNRVGEDKILTSESCCETYIDVLDIALILDTDIHPRWGGINSVLDNKTAESLPLFTMIYGDYAQCYGSICKLTDPIKAFEYKFIRNIVWGFLPTVEGFNLDELKRPETDEYFEIIKKAVDFHRANKDMFVYGRLSGIPDLSCDDTALEWEFRGELITRRYPEIIAANWEYNGKNLLVLYNTSNEDKKFDIDGKTVTVKKKDFAIC